MNWKCSDFEHLSTKELYSILRERSTVFIVEYAHIHLDIDDKDKTALHVFLLESGHEAANTRPQIGAYARLLPGDELDPEVIIDKLLTSSTRRDDDTHEQLVTHALAAAQTAWPGRPVPPRPPSRSKSARPGCRVFSPCAPIRSTCAAVLAPRCRPLSWIHWSLRRGPGPTYAAL